VKAGRFLRETPDRTFSQRWRLEPRANVAISSNFHVCTWPSSFRSSVFAPQVAWSGL